MDLNKMNSIINDIYNQIKQIPDKSRKEKWHDTQWTIELKNIFKNVADKYEYKVFASIPGCTDGEWLWDVTWADFTQDNKNEFDDYYAIKSIPLIMESEWIIKPNDIYNDFDKLIFGKADIKIFIYQSINSININKTNDILKKRIDKSESTTTKEKYCAIAFNKDTQEFEYAILS
jgi:hypothetical protein